MERGTVGGVVPRCVHVDLHRSRVSDGRRRDPPQDLQPTLEIIVHSASWVTEDFLREHEWITETNVTLKGNVILEALNNDIDVLCPLQLELLWFSAPTKLHRKLVNN